MTTDISVFIRDCATGCGNMCKVIIEFDNGDRCWDVYKTCRCKSKNIQATVDKVIAEYVAAGRDLPVNIVYGPKP